MNEMGINTNTRFAERTFGEWRVLMVDDGKELREAWLRHTRYGIMEMMFGLPYKQTGDTKPMSEDEFWGLVADNLKEYADRYKTEYMDEEDE